MDMRPGESKEELTSEVFTNRSFLSEVASGPIDSRNELRVSCIWGI